MPKPRPLPSAFKARSSLAHRLTRRADRLRQLNTKFGIRPHRVFLVWAKWMGETRGEGDDYVLYRAELLPTPRVSDYSGVTRAPWLAGVVPEGTLRVDQISAMAYTEDALKGLVMPVAYEMASPPNATPRGDAIRQKGNDRGTRENVDFWYEVFEDGRGDDPAARQRYRLFGGPFRQASGLQFTVLLQRASEDPRRDGSLQTDEDELFE